MAKGETDGDTAAQPPPPPKPPAPLPGVGARRGAAGQRAQHLIHLPTRSRGYKQKSGLRPSTPSCSIPSRPWAQGPPLPPPLRVQLRYWAAGPPQTPKGRQPRGVPGIAHLPKALGQSQTTPQHPNTPPSTTMFAMGGPLQ